MQEIKAAALVNDATVQAKAAAARVYCDAKGWRYEFVTMPGQIGAG
jgi:putative hemolysin